MVYYRVAFIVLALSHPPSGRCLLQERMQVLPPARINRAHTNRARSVSKGSICPAPSPKRGEVSDIISLSTNKKATVSGGLSSTLPTSRLVNGLF